MLDFVYPDSSWRLEYSNQDNKYIVFLEGE